MVDVELICCWASFKGSKFYFRVLKKKKLKKYYTWEKKFPSQGVSLKGVFKECKLGW